MRGARPPLLLAALVPLLLAALVPLLLFASPASAQPPRAVLVYVMDITYEDALTHPSLRSLGERGGLGLMTETEPHDAVLRDLGALRTDGVSVRELDPDQLVRELASRGPDQEVLVLVFPAEGEPVPLVLGTGSAGELIRNEGGGRGLTSDTTGRPGLVSNVDLVPTILEFLGEPAHPDSAGNAIRVSGEAPTDLHRTYVEYRRVVTPVGIGVLALALVALGGTVAILLGPRTPSRGPARTIAVGGLFAVSLHVALLPGSWLPTYSWPVVVATLLAVGALVAGAAVAAGRRSPHLAVATVAGAGALLVVVDWLLGWRSLLTPLLGGSALEGTRFVGLGNSYAGLLLSGVVLAAAFLRPWAGVALMAIAAVFAGSPWTGADLGGGVTLCAAAAIWWALRVRRRAGPVEVVVVVVATVAGAALLVLLHRLVPEPSHVTRAVEAAGPGGIVAEFLDRLRLNLASTAATPAIWPALAVVVVATVAAWRRWAPIEPGFRGRSSWRPAVLTLGIAAATGYLVNDTYGLAGVASVYLALALVYPGLVEKMFGRNGRKSQSSKQSD